MRKKLLGLFIGATFAIGVANADMTQFASILPLNPDVYQWRNTSNTCDGGCLFHTGTGDLTEGVGVSFLFQNTLLPALMQDSQEAIMTINAPTDGDDVDLQSSIFTFTIMGSTTTLIRQSLGPNATLSIIRSTPCAGLIDCGDAAFAGKQNLLTATFTGELRGDVGGSNSSLDANTGSFGQDVVFTSDFLVFTGQTGGTIAFSFAPITPVLAQETTGMNHMETWRAGGTGAFSADPGFIDPGFIDPDPGFQTPEPSSLIFSGLGGAMILSGMLRKRFAA